MWWWCPADLTQGARRPAEFLESQGPSFSDCRGHKSWCRGITIVPLYNLYGRFVERLEMLSALHQPKDLEPGYIDDEIAVLGTNTARSLDLEGWADK